MFAETLALLSSYNVANNIRLLQPIRTPRGFIVVPIHYSHDPVKDQEWLVKEKAKYRRESEDWETDWAKEMEMDFTSVSGAAAYSSYGVVNELRGMEYQVGLPLVLTMDFNVEPCIWEVIQIVRGLPCIIDEIRLAPASIEAMVREFRNKYPAHQGELWIYGDSTGHGRNPQTGRSDYDLVRLYFRGYPATLIWKVPVENPRVKDRVNAVNLKMRGVEGQVGMLVNPEKCPELIKDFKEVIIKNGQIVKVKDRKDPYYNRTHASDALGYFVAREWPVIKEVLRNSATSHRRPPRRYGHVLGQLK